MYAIRSYYEIALRAHAQIAGICSPLYCIDPSVMAQAAALLKHDIPAGFAMEPLGEAVSVAPGRIAADAGRYSHASFMKAVSLTEAGKTAAVVTRNNFV